MKTNHALIFGAAMACLSLGAVTEVRAQEAVVQTTTTRNIGTINEFGPEGIVIRSEAAAEPVRYGFTKTTTYVDEDGRPVSIQQVKSGMPVTVEYARFGDRLVASRVIVRRAVTPEGTVIEKKTVVPNDTVIEKRTVVPDDTVVEKRVVVPEPTVVEKKTTTTTTTTEKR